MLNGTMNTTEAKALAEDSPIKIDDPWVLFYLRNHKTLKYEMTKPSDEDIEAEQAK